MTIVKSNSKSKHTTTRAESAGQQDARRRRREKRVREWARLPTIELEQRAGDVLVVPSGWAYQFTHPPTPTLTRVTISQPSRESSLAQKTTDGAHGGENDIVNVGREADGDGDALALHVRLVTQGDNARVLREVARTQPGASPLKRLAPPDHLERLLERARKRRVCMRALHIMRVYNANNTGTSTVHTSSTLSVRRTKQVPIRALQPDPNPTRPDGSGRVGSGSE